MIINLLLQLIYKLFDILLFFNIPSMPDEVGQYMGGFLNWIVSGAEILANYVPLGYILILFGLIISIDIALGVYKFVMWILKKIPMISVS